MKKRAYIFIEIPICGLDLPRSLAGGLDKTPYGQLKKKGTEEWSTIDPAGYWDLSMRPFNAHLWMKSRKASLLSASREGEKMEDFKKIR